MGPWSDEEIQRAYDLAYFLHPDEDIALAVTTEGWEKGVGYVKSQAERPSSPTPSKLLLSQEACLQRGVFTASAMWERDQESENPQKIPRYQPSGDDMLIRYIELLISATMGRKMPHTAVALGCHLYDYQPGQISELFPDHISDVNIRRVHGNLLAKIRERFPYFEIVQNGRNSAMRVKARHPSLEEAERVYDVLETFVWWGTPHFPPMTPNNRIHAIQNLFKATNPAAEAQRVHFLIDHTCGGFALYVCTYNANGGCILLPDPEEKFVIPDFPDNGGGSHTTGPAPQGGGPSAGPPQDDEHRQAPRLSPHVIDLMRRALRRNEHRRRQYHPESLRVRVDGQERMEFNAAGFGEFDVPLHATSLEIFGHDDAGDLLLAAFLLPDLILEEGTHELFSSSESGATFQVRISPRHSDSGEETQGRVRITVTEAGTERSPGDASPATGHLGAERGGQRPSMGFPPGGEHAFTWADVHAYSDAFRLATPSFLHSLFDAIQERAVRLPRTYDAAWPPLELFEQVAAKVYTHPALWPVFIERYATMCLETPNTLLKGAMTWGINELLERGQQAPLGRAIACRLAQPPVDITVHRVLGILCTLRPPLRRFLSDQGCPLAPPDTETLRLRQLADAAIRHIDAWASTQRPTAPALIFPRPAEMEQLISFWHATQSDRGIGIVAMGEMKRVLEAAVSSVQGDEALIRDLCLFLLKKVDGNPHFSTFFAIEALEAVRDAAPAACARLMAEYLRELQNLTVAFGIAVCIAEGYEEGGEDSIAARMRFARSPGAWEAVVTAPGLPEHDLDGFFPIAAEVLNTRRDLDDVAEWMNRRLDLHPAIA